MTNHSPVHDQEMANALFGGDPKKNERFAEMKSHLERSIGKTGEFPEGKLTEKDEGGIQFAIAAKNDKVILQFGTPVAWMGMTPEKAVDFGELLINKAAEVGFVRPIKVTV